MLLVDRMVLNSCVPTGTGSIYLTGAFSSDEAVPQMLADILDASALAQMKEGAYLVNCARGGIVDETALVAAIDSGHLRGAALDTFEGEPHVAPALLERPQIVVTPHTASAGEHTRDRMGRLAVDNVIAVLTGREALTPVPLR